MLTPSLPSPNERGKRWLQAKVQQLLADSCVFRAKVATDSGRNLPPIPGEGCH